MAVLRNVSATYKVLIVETLLDTITLDKKLVMGEWVGFAWYLALLCLYVAQAVQLYRSFTHKRIIVPEPKRFHNLSAPKMNQPTK